MKPKFTWKDGERLYVNGHDLYAGKWRVASIGWDGVNKHPEKWIVYLRLPGLKERLAKQFLNVEDAKRRAEEIVINWIKELEEG